MTKTFLTPDEARAQFGELIETRNGTHQHFAGEGGDWRPVFEEGMVLSGYRFYPSQSRKRPPARYRGIVQK